MQSSVACSATPYASPSSLRRSSPPPRVAATHTRVRTMHPTTARRPSRRSRPSYARELALTGKTIDAPRAAVAAAASTAPAAHAHTAPAPQRSLPAFVAGGEQRIECPVGYHAVAADGVGCACASSTDGSTVPASRTEVTCSTNGRAEADECIFTCPGEASSTE